MKLPLLHLQQMAIFQIMNHSLVLSSDTEVADNLCDDSAEETTPDLDAGTLLKTPKRVEVVELCGGQCTYFGIASGVLKVSAQNPAFPEDRIDMCFNIDGIPLFKPSSLQMWAILCGFHDFEFFIVPLYCGKAKPSPVQEYLSDFLQELQQLMQDGIVRGEKALQNKDYVFVKEVHEEGTLVCDVLRQYNTESFFTDPCDSKLLNIVCARDISRTNRRLFSKQQLIREVCLPANPEPNGEEEGVIPEVWVKDNMVHWPPGANVTEAAKEMRRPASSWKMFPLLKIKFESNEDESTPDGSRSEAAHARSSTLQARAPTLHATVLHATVPNLRPTAPHASCPTLQTTALYTSGPTLHTMDPTLCRTALNISPPALVMSCPTVQNSKSGSSIFRAKLSEVGQNLESPESPFHLEKMNGRRELKNLEGQLACDEKRNVMVSEDSQQVETAVLVVGIIVGHLGLMAGIIVIMMSKMQLSAL
ncbi:hypothetical protein E1301_Tti011216 [Triplophysa tibetana]|uniref:Uncharacterized protein n=1 Tax=Triplophysa tibetana TaxID=1572043 RepID=A0A5A9N0I5_9TELE|nr:hypothetical protein E1301_Tti011216 [Triplophysa tibetana]